MDYLKIRELLSDNQYITELLNYFIVEQKAPGNNQPVCGDWIREKASEEISRIYQLLSAQDGMLINKVIVVQNPNIMEDTTYVENRSDCPRFILLTVVTDVPLVYELNLPVLQTMGVLSLSAWEFSRATARACRYMTEVRISNETEPPVLNKAEVEWISLYIGKQPYQGGDNIQGNFAVDDKLDFDIHLYKLREMEGNPVIERMTCAYDADYAEQR